jgi:hypothetical protein
MHSAISTTLLLGGTGGEEFLNATITKGSLGTGGLLLVLTEYLYLLPAQCRFVINITYNLEQRIAHDATTGMSILLFRLSVYSLLLTSVFVV